MYILVITNLVQRFQTVTQSRQSVKASKGEEQNDSNSMKSMHKK